jgi:hypothetical protein
MADTYGSRDENRFKVNGVEYYTLVDAKTGLITVKSPFVAGNVAGSNADRSVGTIPATGANKGKFQSVPGITNAAENTYFTKPENTKTLKNQAEITANKAQQKEGVSAAAANARTNELLSNGKATTAVGVTTASAASVTEDLGKERGGTRDKFPTTLKYPENLQAKFQDVIQFSMVKYSPKTFNTGDSESLSAFNERRKINPSGKDKNIIGVVTLPIPGGIGDGNLVDWGSNSIDVMQASLAGIANAAIGGGGGAGADAANNKINAVANNADAVRNAAKNYFTEEATGTQNTLSRTQGAVLNPNMELLFNGPQLRPFSFTFKLSPRSKKEAENVRGIIRFFKQGMSPIRTQSNLFLKAPHTFQIQYLHIGKEHKFINKIKECALLSFVVNYTPESNYATFTDGAMVSYEIQMQFTELEPIFNDDYGLGTGSGGPDTEIGY